MFQIVNCFLTSRKLYEIEIKEKFKYMFKVSRFSFPLSYNPLDPNSKMKTIFTDWPPATSTYTPFPFPRAPYASFPLSWYPPRFVPHLYTLYLK